MISRYTNSKKRLITAILLGVCLILLVNCQLLPSEWGPFADTNETQEAESLPSSTSTPDSANTAADTLADLPKPTVT